MIVTGYLLDTNHLSCLATLQHPLRERVAQCATRGDVFHYIDHCVVELVFGIALLPRADATLREWKLLAEGLVRIVNDVDDAIEAGLLQARLRKRGRQLDTVDAMIAISAFRSQLTVLTTDRDFEAIPEMPAENWLKR